MNADSKRTRVAAAQQVAGELTSLLQQAGREGVVWYQRMRQVADDLSVPDATDDERLAAARERFDSMYVGGRNFSDFHLWRTDGAERIAANEQLSALVAQLRGLLHDN